MSLPAVVEAARGAFRLGFAYTSCRGLDDDGQPLLEVTVMHRGGDQLNSQVRLTAEEGEQEFNAAARLLAQLLGIPVLSAAQQAQQFKAEALQPVESSQAALAVTAVTPVTESASQEPALVNAAGPTQTAAAAEAIDSPAKQHGSTAAAPSPAETPAPPAATKSLEEIGRAHV